MTATRYSVHGVLSIAVKYEESPDGTTKWVALTLRDSDGGFHEITAFVPGPVELAGAEFINFMAAKEPA